MDAWCDRSYFPFDISIIDLDFPFAWILACLLLSCMQYFFAPFCRHPYKFSCILTNKIAIHHTKKMPCILTHSILLLTALLPRLFYRGMVQFLFPLFILFVSSIFQYFSSLKISFNAFPWFPSKCAFFLQAAKCILL